MPYPIGAVVFSQGHGTGQIWLDNVNCRGPELRLEDCPANPIGVNDCTHREDVVVICQSKILLVQVHKRYRNNIMHIPSPQFSIIEIQNYRYVHDVL